MEEQNNLEQPVFGEAGIKNSFLVFVEKNFLAVSILIAGFLIASSVLYTNGGVGPIKAQINPGTQGEIKADVSVDDDPVLGDKDAPVTIIEFSDYQCPFCRVFWKESFSQLKKEYIDTGKVMLVYRDYPLSFHPSAQISAQGAECAGDQGRYWDMHNIIFAEQEKLGQGTVSYTAQDVKNWASKIGLNIVLFNQCLDSGKYKAEVEKDFNDGNAARVSGTPAFFINGKLVVGAQPYSVFKNLIEEELNK